MVMRSIGRVQRAVQRDDGVAGLVRRQQPLLARRQVELLLEFGEGAVHVVGPGFVVPVAAQPQAGDRPAQGVEVVAAEAACPVARHDTPSPVRRTAYSSASSVICRRIF